MPIILQSALISNLFFFSQILYQNFKGNFIVRLLGTWQDVDMSGHQVPTYGLVYFLTPPHSLLDLFTSPLKSAIYILFTIGTCAVFSTTWIEVSNSSAKDVAQQLDEQGMTVQGYRRENVRHFLNKYIPVAAALGGVCIGALSIFADLVGAIGSGTGILMMVTIIYGMFETFAKERAKEGPIGLGFGL
jgi:protein transport protein SEC61 subunit alpha